MTFFESIWQTSLDVDAESTGILIVLPSIKVTEMDMGFLDLVACE